MASNERGPRDLVAEWQAVEEMQSICHASAVHISWDGVIPKHSAVGETQGSEASVQEFEEGEVLGLPAVEQRGGNLALQRGAMVHRSA